MAYKVPVGGVFAAVYYQFEDGFQVFDNPALNPEYYKQIDKFLGHGVRITRWNENNNVNMIRGLNNIEAATAADGSYEGELQLEFEATGNLEWMEALMGLKTELENGKIYQYSKKGVPRSLTFLIMIQNEPNPTGTDELGNDTLGGDVFILKGLVLQNTTITVSGQNVPMHVSITAPYASETSLRTDELPEFFTTTENVFNAGQSLAYFWDPTADINDMSSFDSIETVVEEFTMTINHGAELIRGIGSRLARDKYHKYLDYTVEVKSYYRDKERFLEKFYGCRDGPINDIVPPMKRVMLVVQNNKTCGDGYRRYEFEFNNVKMNRRDSSIDIEDAIMETYEFKPFNALIRTWNGEEPEAQFNVSPKHIKQGDLVAMHGRMFPRSSEVKLYVDDVLFANVEVNCSGGFEFRFMAAAADWAIGNHVIEARAYSGADVLVSKTQTVFVTGENVNAIPIMSICPQLTTETGAVTDFFVRGYNFGLYADTLTATMSVTCPDGVTAVDITSGTVTDTELDIIESFSGTVGSFHTGTFTLTLNQTGVYTVRVEQVFTEVAGGGSYIVTSPLYVAGVGLTSSDGTLRTITGVGLKPYERTTLYIDDTSGDLQYVGATAADSVGTVVFAVVIANNDTAKTTQLRQDVILNDGSGQLIVSSEIIY